MKRQEIFNKVAKHLLKQNEQSMTKTNPGLCAYRGAKGLKCAVGCLIPDDMYSSTFEGLGVKDLPPDVRKSCGIMNAGTLQLVDDLQEIHDCSSGRHWPAELVDLGERYRLDVSIVHKTLKKLGRSL
jgi:hypothetical protein